MGDEITDLRRQLSVAPDDAWEELDYLGARNRLLELGDRAIQHAERDALDRLRKAAIDATDERLKDGAMTEIARVRAAYESGLRSGSYTLPVGQLFPALRQKSELDLGVDQLIKVLLDQTVQPEYRAKAAYLLADHRGGRASEALAKALAGDPHLDVVREACLTFCEMTGYRTRDHFDTAAAGRWWAGNRARVLAVFGS